MLFNRKNDDFVMFGERKVEVPKLTVEKWKLLFEQVHTLPQLVLDVVSSRGTGNFGATLMAALMVSIDEIVDIVAALSGLESEWILKNAGHNEMLEFISKTIKKNDLSDTAKKSLAPFVKLLKPAAGAGK